MKTQEQIDIPRSIPFLTLFLAAGSLLLQLSPGLAPLLQYDRELIGGGEWWRLVTCHWVHWSFDHFIWCTVALVALGSICERISFKGYAASMTAASIVIPLLLWITEPRMLYYRGLSGLASAAFVYGAMGLAGRALAEKKRVEFILTLAAGAGYLLKIIYESVTGLTLFVESGGIFSPVPAAHLAGGVIGLAVIVSGVFAPVKKQQSPPCRYKARDFFQSGKDCTDN